MSKRAKAFVILDSTLIFLLAAVYAMAEPAATLALFCLAGCASFGLWDTVRRLEK